VLQTTQLQLSTQKATSWVARKGACGRRQQVQIPFTNWAYVPVGLGALAGGRRERAAEERKPQACAVAAAQPHDRCYAAVVISPRCCAPAAPGPGGPQLGGPWGQVAHCQLLRASCSVARWPPASRTADPCGIGDLCSSCKSCLPKDFAG
jgi:hypothetical protein